jgi:hypothetical protein
MGLTVGLTGAVDSAVVALSLDSLFGVDSRPTTGQLRYQVALEAATHLDAEATAIAVVNCVRDSVQPSG